MWKFHREEHCCFRNGSRWENSRGGFLWVDKWSCGSGLLISEEVFGTDEEPVKASVSMNASCSSQVDWFQTSIHLEEPVKEERLLCFVDTVSMHDLTSIERSVGCQTSLNALPVGFSPPGSKSMDIGKDESIANDTHPCTEATVRVHWNHSNKMSLMYSGWCVLILIRAFLLSLLAFLSRVFIFRKGNTATISIWSHWCLTTWSYRNSYRGHASHSDDTHHLSSLVTWEDPWECQSVLFEVEWCASVFLFSLTLILL